MFCKLESTSHTLTQTWFKKTTKQSGQNLLNDVKGKYLGVFFLEIFWGIRLQSYLASAAGPCQEI